MYDEPQRPIETFQRNVTKLTLKYNRKKFMRSLQMTLHDTFKHKSTNPIFFVKKFAHLTGTRT